jgi:hypothetical protein
MENKIQNLKQFLEDKEPGPVSEEFQGELKNLLASCWYVFDGSTENKMSMSKVYRMESPEWDPPFLSFTIERHGGTALGSSRAELQRWKLNIDEKSAVCGPCGYRQVSPRSAPWKAEPVGEELAGLILKGKKDPRLKWYDKGKVEVLNSVFIPDGPKMTTEGRRKRLYAALERILVPAGWQRSRNTWRKTT